jgi:hypothetical protein
MLLDNQTVDQTPYLETSFDIKVPQNVEKENPMQLQIFGSTARLYVAQFIHVFLLDALFLPSERP